MIRPVQTMQPRSGEHCFCTGRGPQGRPQRSGHRLHNERTPGLWVITTSVRAPRANAFAERWVRNRPAGVSGLDADLGRRQLVRVLDEYVRHYNDERPHRSLDLRAPHASSEESAARVATAAATAVRRGLPPGSNWTQKSASPIPRPRDLENPDVASRRFGSTAPKADW